MIYIYWSFNCKFIFNFMLVFVVRMNKYWYKLISKTNDFIKSLNISSTKTIIGHRQIYASSMGEGKTAVEKQKKSIAVEEIKQLSEQILSEVK